MADNDLTLFLGPNTALGNVLNAIVRVSRGVLPEAGFRAYPNRLAMPLIQKCRDTSQSVDLRIKALEDAAGGMPMFLSAPSFFGWPKDVFTGEALLPAAGQKLQPLKALGLRPRIILSIDSLPGLLAAHTMESIRPRGRNTGWDTLYELSWGPAIVEIANTLPDTEITVLTHRTSAIRSPDTLSILFGPACTALPDAHQVLRMVLNQTGKAVMSRMEDTGLSPKVSEELYESFGVFPRPGEGNEALGFDKTTSILLAQRFQEDLAFIRQIPNVRVF